MSHDDMRSSAVCRPRPNAGPSGHPPAVLATDVLAGNCGGDFSDGPERPENCYAKEQSPAARHDVPAEGRGGNVLYTLAVILLVLWLLGMVSGYTIGAFIHVLLVIAIVLVLVQIISGRRVSL